MTLKEFLHKKLKLVFNSRQTDDLYDGMLRVLLDSLPKESNREETWCCEKDGSKLPHAVDICYNEGFNDCLKEIKDKWK